MQQQSSCQLWSSCLWQGFLGSLGIEQPVDDATDLKNQWAVIARASGEASYRSGVGGGNVDEMYPTYSNQVLEAIRIMTTRHTMTLAGIVSHMSVQRYHLVHIYCVPVELGNVATFPGSEYGKKYALRVFFGSRQSFRQYVNDELKISEADLETRMYSAGFETKE